MEDIRIQPDDAPSAGYAALSESAGLVEFPHTTILRLTGKDPIGMLDAVLTNEVPKDEHLGTYAALLNPKGRVQTDLRVLKGDEDVLVLTESEGAETAKEILGRYATFSRVKIEDHSSGDEPWGILGIYGPRAKSFFGDPVLAEHETMRTEIGGASVLVTGVAAPVYGYDVICPSSTLDAVRNQLLEAGAIPARHDDYETARVLSGLPLFGMDITPDNFPGESEGFLERAVSFGKGCYPGQETVARMRYRGSPNKKLYRFVLDGDPPVPGTEITQDEKQVGTLTSVAPLPVNGTTFALGYLSRKADPEGQLHTGDAKLRTLSG